MFFLLMILNRVFRPILTSDWTLVGLLRPQNTSKLQFLVQLFFLVNNCLYSSATFMIRKQAETALFCNVFIVIIVFFGNKNIILHTKIIRIG